MWIDLIGEELNNRELLDLKDRFNTDGFYCEQKNSLEYKIGVNKEGTKRDMMYISRDRAIVLGHHLQTYCSSSEVELVASKLQLVRPNGLKYVIECVTNANKFREPTKPYAPPN